eukprot:SAG31_NODE_1182_length_9512_cov_3.773611_4_plen_124_part_00
MNMVTGVAGYVAVAVEAADGNAPPAGAAQFGLTHANHLKGNAIAAVASWDRGADHRASSLSAWQGRQGKDCYFLVFCATIRDIRDFNRESVCINSEAAGRNGGRKAFLAANYLWPGGAVGLKL